MKNTFAFLIAMIAAAGVTTPAMADDAIYNFHDTPVYDVAVMVPDVHFTETTPRFEMMPDINLIQTAAPSVPGPDINLIQTAVRASDLLSYGDLAAVNEPATHSIRVSNGSLSRTARAVFW